MSKYGVFSGPYFPVFGLNTEIYGVKKTPYLDTFHAVKNQYSDIFQRVRAMKTIFNCLLLTLQKKCFYFLFHVIHMLLLPCSNKICNRDCSLVLKVIKHYVFFLFYRFSTNVKLFFSLSSLTSSIEKEFLLDKI